MTKNNLRQLNPCNNLSAIAALSLINFYQGKSFLLFLWNLFVKHFEMYVNSAHLLLVNCMQGWKMSSVLAVNPEGEGQGKLFIFFFKAVQMEEKDLLVCRNH